MKNTFQSITLVLGLAFALMGCEKDNYEPPSALLSGRLVYQGEPIYVEYDRVSYELYQNGFGKTGPLGSTFTQEGEFSQLLFDGDYQMVIPTGQGPFVTSQNDTGGADTMQIALRGSETLDIEVTPFWMIRNPQLGAGDGSVTGTFALEQIATGSNARDIESVTLYVSKTAFANSQTNVASTTVGSGDLTDLSAVSLSAEVPELIPTQNYVFASIGVKFAGVDDLIFSPTQKLDL